MNMGNNILETYLKKNISMRGVTATLEFLLV